MNELINCLRYNKMDQFRNKFRNMDILLIDDSALVGACEHGAAEPDLGARDRHVRGLAEHEGDQTEATQRR
jgi:hypothetical protein